MVCDSAVVNSIDGPREGDGGLTRNQILAAGSLGIGILGYMAVSEGEE